MTWNAQRFIDDRVSADANVAEVTGGFFDVLGVQPVLGRALTLGDDKEGTENVIVLSNGFWHGRYGLLSTVGLYAAMAAFVRQRDREIAIRLAVGAHATRIRNFVLVENCSSRGAGSGDWRGWGTSG
jgi:hypothetical protein